MSGSFTDVPLRTLLSNAGLITDPNVKNDLLGKYLVAIGHMGHGAIQDKAPGDLVIFILDLLVQVNYK